MQAGPGGKLDISAASLKFMENERAPSLGKTEFKKRSGGIVHLRRSHARAIRLLGGGLMGFGRSRMISKLLN